MSRVVFPITNYLTVVAHEILNGEKADERGHLIIIITDSMLINKTRTGNPAILNRRHEINSIWEHKEKVEKTRISD